MARNEVWIRTDHKLIRADAVQAVEWNEHPPTVLMLRATGERSPLTVRVQPDVRDPTPYSWDEKQGLLRAAVERAAGLDEKLLVAIAAAAKASGGAIVYLEFGDDRCATGWGVDPLRDDEDGDRQPAS